MWTKRLADKDKRPHDGLTFENVFGPLPPTMKIKQLGLLTTFALLSYIAAFSQEDSDSSNTLFDQFENLKKTSNNYQNYEVIDRAKLEAFWSQIDDSLTVQQQEISSLKKDLSSTQQNVSNLESQVSERDSKIGEQAELIDNMSFLGIQIGKGTYVTITWAIIFALIALVLIIYFRFKNANKVTTETRKEIQSLQEEFETHRQRSRENETKIKRDLQTEINRVEELKERLGES